MDWRWCITGWQMGFFRHNILDAIAKGAGIIMAIWTPNSEMDYWLKQPDIKIAFSLKDYYFWVRIKHRMIFIRDHLPEAPYHNGQITQFILGLKQAIDNYLNELWC